MNRTYLGTSRHCATCVYWFGPREPQLVGKLVAVMHDARAACNHPARTGMTTIASEVCGRWVQLGSLR